MNRHFLSALALAALSATVLVAADPFIGAWKLNIARSNTDYADPRLLNEPVKIQDLGQDRYQITARDGQTTGTVTGMLSSDGRTLTCIEQDPNRPIVLRRVGAGIGFPGLWESIDLVISPWRGDGLAFYYPLFYYTLNMKFDGKNWPGAGGDSIPSASSGKRLSRNSLQITDEEESHVIRHTTYTVSSDGKMMTLTWHEMDQPDAFTAVYDKK